MREEGGVVFGGVDVQRDERVVDSEVDNAWLVAMFDLSGGRSGRGLEESFNQLSTGKKGMAMFGAMVRHDRPLLIFYGGHKGAAQVLDGRSAHRRTVYQRDNGSVTAAIEHL